MDTTTLLALIAGLMRHDTFLLNLIFPNVVTFGTSEIAFDQLDETHKLAPFVSPYVAGKARSSEGSVLRKLKPAYVKPKNVVDPERVLVRKAGEAVAGSLTSEQRANAIRVDILDQQRRQIMSRMEWMAAQLLRTGKILVSGDDYPTVEVDFGRDSDNTIALSGGARWTVEASRDPNADLRDWMRLMDAPCTHIIMGGEALSLYLSDEKTQKLIDSRRGSATVLEMAPSQMFATFVGRLGAGGPEIWEYSGWYHNEAGEKTTFIAEDEVLLVSTGAPGVRAYGAILDGKANYQALEMFPKNWVSDDPALEYIMTQSAPLPVLPLINASVCAKVTAAA